MRIRDEVLAAIPRIDNEVKTHIAEYYAMISHLDDRINDVISSLKENGIYDNTIIIFIADNGLAVGQHGLMGKQNLYEHSVNVPMIIKMNGQNQEQKINDHLCYLIDIFPTVCDWIDKHVPQSVDGKSLTPIIENNTPIRDYLCFAYTDLQRSVSDGEWKLIEYNVNGEKHTQLFNLKNDPMEINNLIHDNSLNDKVDTLRLKMTQLKEETNDNSKFWEQ